MSQSNERFLDNLEKTISLSDKLGFVYWFAVLTTISCGCATGIYMTLSNKFEMIKSCQEKYELYENFIIGNRIDLGRVPWPLIENGTIFERHTLNNHDEINDLASRIAYFEQQIG